LRADFLDMEPLCGGIGRGCLRRLTASGRERQAAAAKIAPLDTGLLPEDVPVHNAPCRKVNPLLPETGKMLKK
jgi:hypothetical protein